MKIIKYAANIITIARITNTSSKAGEILDSTADLFFTAVMLFIFIPLIAWKRWMICGIVIIAFVRLLSLCIGFFKYHVMSSLHTYTNKITGLLLFCFPIIYCAAGLNVTVSIVCCVANLSAFEELIVTIKSKELNRNVTSMFCKNS